MPTKRFGALCVVALTIAACGSDDEEAAIPAAAGSAPVALAIDGPAPAHGGTVVAAGDQHVEVVPHEDGTVHAFVVTADPPPPDRTRITVRMPADDGRTHPVVLTWDPSEERYRGRLRRVRPVAGPIDVVVVVGRERYEGHAPQVVVVAPGGPAPRADVHVVAPERPRGHVDVVVQEPPQPHVVVHAPSPPRPHVVVHAPSPPRPHVVVHAPSPPRPHVVVHAPRPRHGVVVHRPGRVRVHHDNGRHRGRVRGRHGHRGRGHRHH